MTDTPTPDARAPPPLLTAAESKRMIEVYAALMTEIKERTLSLDPILNGQTGIRGPMARELCYLQLRMICECIAFACVVAHGDRETVQTKQFQKNYAADKILHLLEELHDDFYPKPITVQPLALGGINLAERSTDFLTRAGVRKLVGKCNDKVHRGYLRDYTPPKQFEDEEFREIRRWGQRIINLLESHRIGRYGGLEHIICWWKSEESDVVRVVFGAPGKAP